MKHCSRCNQTLALSAFGACAAAADGMQAWCKECKLDAKREARDKQKSSATQDRDWHAFVEKTWQSHQLHYKMPGEYGMSPDLRIEIWRKLTLVPVAPHPGLPFLYQATTPEQSRMGVFSAFRSEAELTAHGSM